MRHFAAVALDAFVAAVYVCSDSIVYSSTWDLSCMLLWLETDAAVNAAVAVVVDVASAVINVAVAVVKVNVAAATAV